MAKLFVSANNNGTWIIKSNSISHVIVFFWSTRVWIEDGKRVTLQFCIFILIDYNWRGTFFLSSNVADVSRSQRTSLLSTFGSLSTIMNPILSNMRRNVPFFLLSSWGLYFQFFIIFVFLYCTYCLWCTFFHPPFCIPIIYLLLFLIFLFV